MIVRAAHATMHQFSVDTAVACAMRTTRGGVLWFTVSTFQKTLSALSRLSVQSRTGNRAAHDCAESTPGGSPPPDKKSRGA